MVVEHEETVHHGRVGMLINSELDRVVQIYSPNSREVEAGK